MKTSSIVGELIPNEMISSLALASSSSFIKAEMSLRLPCFSAIWILSPSVACKSECGTCFFAKFINNFSWLFNALLTV